MTPTIGFTLDELAVLRGGLELYLEEIDSPELIDEAQALLDKLDALLGWGER